MSTNKDTRRSDKFKNQKKRFKTHKTRTKKDAMGPRMPHNNSNAYASKARLQEMAAETVEIIEDIGHYRFGSSNKMVSIKDNQEFSKKKTITYMDNNLTDLFDNVQFILDDMDRFDTEFEVELETTLEGMSRLRKDHPVSINIAALNFASAKNPGGAFLKGAVAQEESLAYASGLYGCLKDSPVYEANQINMKNGLYHDSVIYSPDVPVFRDKDSNFLYTPFPITILSTPAVNVGVTQKNNISETIIDNVMRNRMDLILAVAVKHKVHVLILGSWGCGVFRNDIKKIAPMMIDLLTNKYEGAFQQVCFSVMDEDHQSIFEECLNDVFS